MTARRVGLARRSFRYGRGILLRARNGWTDRRAGPPLASTPSESEASARAAESVSILRRILVENILPFWVERVIDEDDGGYRLHHDKEGNWLGPANKGLISQARTVWFFSRLRRSDFGEPFHLEIARHGFEFLRDRLWDSRYGGFFWEIEPTGHPVKPHKHIRAQAFGLFALTEFAAAADSDEAKTLATRLVDLIERHGHDGSHGGYYQWFGPDWSKPTADQLSWSPGDDPEGKRANTQLHVLEAYSPYYRLSANPLVGDRLKELIVLLLDTTVDHDLHLGIERSTVDWKPLREGGHNRVSYGHDLERIWLAEEACRVVGLPVPLLLPAFESLFEGLLRFGYDRSRGGFFEQGPVERPAMERTKVWWVQAEAMVTATLLYRLTRRPRYGQAYLETLDWVVRAQVDWDRGEWFAFIRPDGEPAGPKASVNKTPYHTGRSMLMCLENLESAEGVAPAGGRS